MTTSSTTSSSGSRRRTMPDVTRRILGRPGTVPTAPPPIDEKPPEGGGPKVQPTIMKPPRNDRSLVPISTPKARRVSGELSAVIQAAAIVREELMQKPHVIDVRGGYKFINGRITNMPAVVVVVDRKVRDLPAESLIPPSLQNGIPTDVAPADPYELLAAAREAAPEQAAVIRAPRLLIDELQPGQEAFVEEAVRQITYEPPPNGNLEAVTGAMTITCHVSPDCGWSVLKSFLEKTEREICLGMYDF